MDPLLIFSILPELLLKILTSLHRILMQVLLLQFFIIKGGYL